MLRTKEEDPKYENLPKMELTEDDYVFHPNLSYIILDHFVIVSHHYG